jgi:hypothetical protein
MEKLKETVEKMLNIEEKHSGKSNVLHDVRETCDSTGRWGAQLR